MHEGTWPPPKATFGVLGARLGSGQSFTVAAQHMNNEGWDTA